MKKIFTGIAIALLLSLSLFAFTGCEFTSFTGSSSNMNHNYNAGVWTVSAARVNGNLRRSVTMSAENLENFRAVSTATEGTVELVLTQGDTIERIALDDSFVTVQHIDMSAFNAEDGRIQVRLNFANVRNLSAIISWN